MGYLQDAKKKKKILVGILAVSIVTIILGLGLGLGLQLENCQNEVVVHCRGRCYEPYDPQVAGCRCDANCTANNNCCYDYHDVCLLPAEQWVCTRLRCGETRMTQSRCQCSSDCLQAGDCCSNYKHVCHGEKAWVEDECQNMTEPHCPASFKRPPLLLVSLDGLRADYLQTWGPLLPVLSKLVHCGTSAPYMQAAFPSKTFPNHYAIATGLYPESNGLIDNVMYDPVFDASFSLSNQEKDNPRWYLGQPIWHTARYQGLKSGTFFWPGSDVKVNGSFPDFYMPYNGKVPFEERVFTVLKWLQLPDDKRPDFFTLYLEEPDKSGHKFGTISGGLTKALQGVDDIMGQLMNGLKQLSLHRCLNIIILADHGMEDTSCERKTVLQDLVDIRGLWVTEGPVGRIRARDKNTVLDSAALVANMSCKKPEQKISPYLKPHLPKRFHYANSRRIEVVNVLVTPKWLFERSRGSLRFCSGGAHGYDNDVESMHAMFLSHGPAFQHQTAVEPFSNIELYNLMCDVLEISPSQNNGTHGSLNHLLRRPYYLPSHPTELTAPFFRPILTLEPSDTLGCSCPAIVQWEHQFPEQSSQSDSSRRYATYCTLHAPYLYSTCTIPVLTCTLPVLYLYLHLTCSLPVLYLYLHLTCSLPVLYLYPHLTYSLPVPAPYLFSTCTLPVPAPYRFSTCTLPVLYLFSTCTLPVPAPYLFSTCTCTLPVLYLYLTCTVYLCVLVEVSMRTHAVLGRPVVLQQGESYCLLQQQGFVSGYSQRIFMPLWSSYSLDALVDLDPLPAGTASCLRADIRVPSPHSPRCDQYFIHPSNNISYSFLYPPGLSAGTDELFDGLVMTNVVPMFPAFKKIWEYFHSTLLKKYSQQYGGINVVTGPAFDYNFDGRFDSMDQIQEYVPDTRIPIPTHYFAVMTSCANKTQTLTTCTGKLQTVSFLLPHRHDNTESCQSAESESHWVEDLMWFHQSRVRDVEWITGLDFYQGSSQPITELLQLKTRPTAAIHRKP
ncbi:Ectonucleotide pyrophosphatase/phosphodiesterase family member 1 [Merluccius polli]|uniref:Ectonucleotide pyrophosphatase/phosphodiesterase family member 1 n=1 Tax=Merluccius polli TaxID=89951 RepID=A0AA47MTB4_MERPO|nr:Ectonucleotide pyrophosphatase/phosphodiesterase family member 1 [Merluccius polli]